MSYDVAGLTTQTPALQHQATVYYDRVALDRLTPQFRFHQAGEPKTIPLNSGKTVQFYRRSVPAYNNTPATEGVIPAPFVNGTATISGTVEQYSDYMSASTLLEDTDIAPTVEGMIDDLTIRAAGSVDTIIRQEFDSNTGAQVATAGSNLAVNDLKKQGKLMEGLNIKPRMGTKYLGIIHPYNAYDIITDNTAGAFIDALKYQQGQRVLDGEIGEVANVRFLTSTNVGNDGVAAANTKYFVYVIGAGGVGVIDLAGKGPDGVTDPQMERFRVNVIKGGASPSDPTGEIGTYVSYRFVFCAKTLDSTNYRFRILKADSSII